MSAQTCFEYASGYGYDDLGRDKLEKVYADVFHTESALVRPQITCGTHALALALSANLRPGDELGIRGRQAIRYTGRSNRYPTIKRFSCRVRCQLFVRLIFWKTEVLILKISQKQSMIIQRLLPFSVQKVIRPDQVFQLNRLVKLIAFVKKIKPDVICMVDNCYGEFVETIEPSDVGADMVVGSLIKNPGGGLAPIGGYIAGREDLIENCGYRLTSPGLGREVGASLGVMKDFYQGFFLAPTVTASALKGAIFAANIYEKLGCHVIPNGSESRHDIIQAVELWQTGRCHCILQRYSGSCTG